MNHTSDVKNFLPVKKRFSTAKKCDSLLPVTDELQILLVTGKAACNNFYCMQYMAPVFYYKIGAMYTVFEMAKL